MKHDLYKTGDKDAYRAIKDTNGEVVLDCCRRCGLGEIELTRVKECCSKVCFGCGETVTLIGNGSIYLCDRCFLENSLFL